VPPVAAFSPENSANNWQRPKRFPLPPERHSDIARRAMKHCGDIIVRDRDLEARFNEELKDAEQQIRDLFKDDGHTVKARAKTNASTISKLFRLASEHKVPLPHIHKVMPRLKDAIGIRIILKQGSDAEMNQVIQKLANAVQKNELRILEIENYRGRKGIPYLSDHQFKELSDATQLSHGYPLLRGPEEVKKSGYTCVQMIIEFKNGAIGELQIRGPKVDQISQAEHLAYDLRRNKGKPIPDIYPPHIKTKMEKLKTILTGLNAKQQADYLTYLTEQFNHARATELGIERAEQPLPESLREYPELDIQELLTLHDEIEANKSTQRSKSLDLVA
jgi:ppGpp synthetase/RelA/SpoT-type nucleotidyltranferase